MRVVVRVMVRVEMMGQFRDVNGYMMMKFGGVVGMRSVLGETAAVGVL